MAPRRADTLDSYEGIPLDSPERRMIQNRNAQRVYRAKKANPRPGQSPSQPAEPQRDRSTSASMISTTPPPPPSPPPPTLPQSKSKYSNGPTISGPFPPPDHFEQGHDDFISRMLTDEPGCSNAFTDMLAETFEPAQESSGSATADTAFPWGTGDFRSDFSPLYRPGENASPSTNALTTLDTSLLQSTPNTGVVPPTLVRPSTVLTRTSPYSPSSPIATYPTPPYQDCAPETNTSNAPQEENLLSGGVWRHPIHTAAQSGHTRIIQLLLQSGCDVSLKDGTGRTPLHISAAEGHTGAVRLLMRHGSDSHALDNLGWTPIHLATRNGHTDCVELLLKLGL
ncbi:MAG: hypothetical protein Q9178_003859 [Gyalolechia marmorata]